VSRFDEVLEGFRAGLAIGRLGSAYLIVGPPRGEGLALAEQLLGLLFCEGASKPCGTCRGCRDLRARSLADVLWIEPIRKSQRILVEQIVEIHRRMYQTSFGGGWKAAVLIGADRLNDDAANKFLKVLEEPPGQSLFLLLSDQPQSVLPTILSRCQRVSVSGAESGLPAPIEGSLREIVTADPVDAHIAGLWSARQLIGLLRAVRKEIEAQEKDSAAEAEGSDVIDARVNARYKEVRTAMMRWLLLWHRDVMVAVASGGRADFVSRDPDLRQTVLDRASRLSLKRALDNLRLVERMQEQLERNLPEHSVFSVGFSRLASPA
jgi:DNA polymerase III subunit delta'